MKTAASTSAGPIDLFMMASIFRIGGATFIDHRTRQRHRNWASSYLVSQGSIFIVERGFKRVI
jgi:hypothetical protein